MFKRITSRSNHGDCTRPVAMALWNKYREHLRTGNSYLVYPHGMLELAVQKSNPIKHIKKQVYWWCRQGKILKRASAACFTTEEERRSRKDLPSISMQRSCNRAGIARISK